MWPLILSILPNHFEYSKRLVLYYILSPFTKNVQNRNAIVYQLILASIRATNHKLEVVRKKKQEKEQMVKKWNTKAIAVKCNKKAGRIYLSDKKQKNHDSDTENNIDPNQVKCKYLILRINKVKTISK